MKLNCQILITTIATAGMAVGAWAAISDVDVHVASKRVDFTPPDNKANSTRSVSKEHWNYEVTVENKTFKPMEPLEVKYMIFYKTEELASKNPPAQKHLSGSSTIDGLKPHEKKGFTTNAIELSKSHLTGTYYYPGGERIRAEDTLSGVWVRVLQGGQQIAEFANPSSLTKEKWE